MGKLSQGNKVAMPLPLHVLFADEENYYSAQNEVRQQREPAYT
jgi:hypothetical protein